MMKQTKELVRERYTSAAKKLKEQKDGNFACGSCCSGSNPEALNVDLTYGSYVLGEDNNLKDIARASLGCGNPVVLAQLAPGEIVLDLGSGAGLDVLLSAKRVAPDGKAYGLDMTDEMLELARINQQRSGITNAEFLKGDIENIPIPDNHVDVIISNCVINLSTDKDQALKEAARVLKPQGRLAIMDLVFTKSRNSIPQDLVKELEERIGCIVGALEVSEYEDKLHKAGFTEIAVEIVQEYSTDKISGGGSNKGSDCSEPTIPIASAFIRARKPALNL